MPRQEVMGVSPWPTPAVAGAVGTTPGSLDAVARVRRKVSWPFSIASPTLLEASRNDSVACRRSFPKGDST
jgi:hypothetical protein